MSMRKTALSGAQLTKLIQSVVFRFVFFLEFFTELEMTTTFLGSEQRFQFPPRRVRLLSPPAPLYPALPRVNMDEVFQRQAM